MSPWKNQTEPETLSNLRPGVSAVVLGVQSDNEQTLRLREMGLCAGAFVEVLNNDSTVLVRVGEQRLCLAADYAREVTVLPH